MGLSEEVGARIEAIRRDRTSGATALALQAAEALEMAAVLEEPEWVGAARAVAAAQPAMAPLFNLANAALLSADRAGACTAFAARIRESMPRVAAHGARLIAPGMTVMTHSASSAVLDALRAGRPALVIATESRPVREGLILAGQLAREGIAVRLIVDAAMDLFLDEAQLALVGADSVSPAGVMNKIGTALLALVCDARRVPLYALCGTEKFVPAARAQQARNPREVLERPIERIDAVNYYFDTTPLERFRGIVTEDGVLAAADIRARLADMPVHEALRAER